MISRTGRNDLVSFWVLFRQHPLRLPATLLTFTAIGLTQMASYVTAKAALIGIRCPAGMMDRVACVPYQIAWAGLIVIIPGAHSAIAWMGLF